MPTNEKEYNGYLFDQLSLIEEITEVAEKEHATETLAILEKKRNRWNASFTSSHHYSKAKFY